MNTNDDILWSLAGTDYEEALTRLSITPSGWNATELFGSDDIGEVRDALLNLNLIRVQDAPPKRWELTRRGKGVVEMMRDSRIDGALRKAAVEKHLMRSIHTWKRSRTNNATDAIMGDTIEGIEVTTDEHHEAVEALRHYGFIKGINYSGDGTLISPVLTTAGRDALYDARSPSDFHYNISRGVSIQNKRVHVNFTGPVSSVSTGDYTSNRGGNIHDHSVTDDHSVMNDHSITDDHSVTVTNISDALVRLKEEIGRLNGLDVPTGASHALDELGNIDDPSEVKPGRIKQLTDEAFAGFGSKLGDTAFTGVTAALGSLASMVFGG